MDAAKVESSVDPRRYFEGVGTDTDRPEQDPVCLYLETTNRCNLLCTTCPRTYEELEPPADMSWQLFCSIVDQIPNLSRAVLHGVGEPMLVKNLPRMVRYLKHRGTYVLFNTNGTVLNDKNGRALIEAGLDELRVSFDAANAESYKAIRGKNYFNRILRNVRAFRDLQEREGCSKPRVSAWLTGLRETVEQLPEFVRVAAEAGVREVYLQRLVFFAENAIGKARADQALYEQLSSEEASHIDHATAIAASLGITFSASGAASEPGMNFKRSDNGSPWSLCRRPWTVMYITANGRALPCCIAPFSQRGYEHYTLGDATQQSLREIWQGPAYQAFRRALQSDKPPGHARIAACAGACDSSPAQKTANAASLSLQVRRRSLTASPALDAKSPVSERVAVVIPTFNEAESIAAVIATLPRHFVDHIIVADGGSTDGTPQIARGAGAEVIAVGPVTGARAWPAPRLPAIRVSWCSWMATGPTIQARSRKWSPRFVPATTTSSSAPARAASARPPAWQPIKFSPVFSSEA